MITLWELIAGGVLGLKFGGTGDKNFGQAYEKQASNSAKSLKNK